MSCASITGGCSERLARPARRRARFALRRLGAAPLNSLLSLLVIGVALTLPTSGWLALDNLRTLTGDTPGVQRMICS